ncbi:MAG TPA: ATP-binding protein [Thermoanaerobaculia bacterium]|nr:ATP-binding protein [Thermoanaerobaculia bacterium]
MPEPLHVHLAIGSRFENIELVQIVLKDSLVSLGLEEDALHWIDIAVREAVANAIKHGNAQDPAKKVDVDLAIVGAELVIQVRDQGEGFDPGQIQNPLAPENLLKPNGRGIFYMKSFMDEINYGLEPGGGTVVTMRKRLPGLAADSEIGKAPGTGDLEGKQ